jgi:hypothetical protein
MDGKSLGTIIGGMIVFIVAQAFIDNVITGSDVGSVLFQTALLIVIAAAVIIGVIKLL